MYKFGGIMNVIPNYLIRLDQIPITSPPYNVGKGGQPIPPLPHNKHKQAISPDKLYSSSEGCLLLGYDPKRLSSSTPPPLAKPDSSKWPLEHDLPTNFSPL